MTSKCLAVSLNESHFILQPFIFAGQVINVLREEKIAHHVLRPQLTEYITIPAWYKAGVTLFMKTDNAHCELLRSVPELQIRSEWGKQVKDDKT